MVSVELLQSTRDSINETMSVFSKALEIDAAEAADTTKYSETARCGFYNVSSLTGEPTTIGAFGIRY